MSPYTKTTAHGENTCCAISFDPLIPAPRANLVRYHGVFAPNAKLRPPIIPRSPTQLALLDIEGRPVNVPANIPSLEGPSQAALSVRPASSSNYVWAELLRRVFEFDVLVCPECGGQSPARRPA